MILQANILAAIAVSFAVTFTVMLALRPLAAKNGLVDGRRPRLRRRLISPRTIRG